MAAEFKPGELIALAFIAGFAIQQFLQVFDLVITPLVIKDKETIWKMPAADFKKSLMQLSSFVCGLLIAWNLDISLLSYLGDNFDSIKGHLLDLLISGFVLGSGTEAANTLIKYFGYLKDAKKYDIEPELEILIDPPSAAVKVTETVRFECVVKNNPNQAVSWRVLQGSTGGEITNGEYKAPSVPGVYDVVATSQADKTKSKTAKITVKA